MIKKKKKIKTPIIIFISLSIICILLSPLFETESNKIVGDVLQRLGVVILSVVIIDQIWRTIGGDPLQSEISNLSNEVQTLKKSVHIIEQTEDVGLIEVYKSKGKYGSQEDWLNLIREAKDEVDLMGRCLYGWTQSLETNKLIIKKITEEQVKFRWLVMSPSNRYLNPLIETDNDIGSILKEKIKATSKLISEIKSELPEKYKSYLEIRQFEDVQLYCSIFRIDNKFIINQYLISLSSGDSPMFVVKDKNRYWFDVYEREFESVWNRASIKTV